MGAFCVLGTTYALLQRVERTAENRTELVGQLRTESCQRAQALAELEATQ